MICLRHLCDIILTTFCCLPLNWPIQKVRTVEGGVVKRHVGFQTNDNFASNNPPAVCLARRIKKDVKRLSQTDGTTRLEAHVTFSNQKYKPIRFHLKTISSPLSAACRQERLWNDGNGSFYRRNPAFQMTFHPNGCYTSCLFPPETDLAVSRRDCGL